MVNGDQENGTKKGMYNVGFYRSVGGIQIQAKKSVQELIQNMTIKMRMM